MRISMLSDFFILVHTSEKMFAKVMKCFVCLGTNFCSKQYYIKMVSYSIVVVVVYLIPHHHAILMQWQRTSKSIMV